MLALWGWLAIAVLQGVLWLWAWRKRDVSIVDVGWSVGVGLMAVGFAALGPGDATRRLIVGTVAGLWAFRLATFLFVNRVVGRTEDGRYRRMREALGSKADAVFFAFFQIQAFWSVLFALPILAVVWNDASSPNVWDILGVLIIVGAIAGESIADAQLAAFRAKPTNRGRTCREGLWRYSRHPNYFFEWLHWFGYIALAVGSTYWWVTIAGPITMLVFLFKVTGIPHTEKQALASRGEDYARYQRETSIFVPWFPRKESH